MKLSRIKDAAMTESAIIISDGRGTVALDESGPN